MKAGSLRPLRSSVADKVGGYGAWIGLHLHQMRRVVWEMISKAMGLNSCLIDRDEESTS